MSSHVVPHRLGVSLSTLVGFIDDVLAVRKDDLRPGDQVVVKTQNSVYVIRLLGGGRCAVSGGWFDRQGLSPAVTTVVGCSWGGSAIKVDVVAACWLRLEFGNRLVTSTIQRIFVLPHGMEN